ncbi:Putative serine/threonine-protein kinase pknH [Minicystis rosea]|nr:Putative serine/threonine-protein kinase pknH [Minicystis rosea]
MLAPALLVGACILDLDGLTGGPIGTGGSTGGHGDGGSTGGHGDGGSTGAHGDGGSETSCAPLDCTSCAAACASAACAPTPLATSKDADGPWAVAVMDGDVYWVNKLGGTVARRTLGSAAPEVLTAVVAPVAIAAAGGSVVWAEQDGLWGCPAEACDANKKKIFGSVAPGSLQGVALDGQFVYFTDRGDGQLTGKVVRCAIDGCAAPLEIVTGQVAPQAITLSGAFVFWTDAGNGEANGNVYRASTTGQGVTQITGNLVSPSAVAADDMYVYFTRSSPDGRVFRCPHGAGYCDAPEDLAHAAAPLAQPIDLALVGGRIYWTERGDGALRSCPQDGCGPDAPRVHASGRDGMRRLAIGSSCLFWVDDTGGGGVFEVPR